MDADGGQPGSTAFYGLGEVNDLQGGATRAGGRTLRLGSRCVMDIRTLLVQRVSRWTLIVPGVPITSLSREGDAARAFSHGKTKHILVVSGLDLGREYHGQAYGFLMVDIATGVATDRRARRRRYRFAHTQDLTPAWLNPHFRW